MLKVLAPAAMIMALAVTSSAAVAAPKSMTAHPTQAASTHATSTKAKDKACAKEWKTQKTHGQTRSAFMAQCKSRA